MEKRAHPPLRRVARGEPLLVDPSLPTSKMLSSGGSGGSGGFEGGLAGEIDSCYSSCSEESHASLSRESSDALSTVSTGLGSMRLGECGQSSPTAGSDPWGAD